MSLPRLPRNFQKAFVFMGIARVPQVSFERRAGARETPE
jgi:hypothetical protein